MTHAPHDMGSKEAPPRETQKVGGSEDADIEGRERLELSPYGQQRPSQTIAHQ